MNSTTHVLKHTLACLEAQTRSIPSRTARRTLNLTARRFNKGHSTTQTTAQKTDESPPLKSRLWAVAIGGLAALAYAAYKRRNAASVDGIQDGFVKYTLVDKEDVSATNSIFTISPQATKGLLLDDTKLQRAIISVQLKQPQLQIARAYTVLPAVPGQPPNALRLLIRKELRGEVSTYLHNLQIGSAVEVRGPYVDYTVPETVGEAIFLAGGTGIAPALRTASILNSTGKLHILWANRRREDCIGASSDTAQGSWTWSGLWSQLRPKTTESSVVPERAMTAETSTIVLMLNLLKRESGSSRDGEASTLSVDYFVDQENTYIDPTAVAKLLATPPTDKSGERLILVSGPDGFIDHWAGPKPLLENRGEQHEGTVGGLLANMSLDGWRVVKL